RIAIGFTASHGVLRGSLENKGFARIRPHRHFPSLWRQIIFQATISLRGARKTSAEQGRIKPISSA
ncbi:MAG TPA: hypothetical protein VMM15_13150, partial [Bradyrhizobium sp.]|nr:hypothetical protein [Bradyrhizobium sp.]